MAQDRQEEGSGIGSVTFAEALDVALCYGWIDSQRGGFDERFFLQRFTPRRPRSKWSQVNREKVAKLIESDRMKPAGLREVERAKADGRWDAAYEPQSAATVPDDLRLELEKNEGARKFFEKLDRANRYAILHRIQDAKRPETRARRIAQYVAMLAEGKKLYP
ncbi:MAG TPA: YdeI/OmpD-associated family protein [Rubrobacter sp.]|nr:YdeI/OmpD-associated family protein [Rubrobacter sp.]